MIGPCIRVALVLCVIAATATPFPTQVRRAAPMSCEAYSWGSPVRVAGSDPPSVVYGSSVASATSGRFLVASDLMALEGPGTHVKLVARDISAGSIGRPRGEFVFAFPKSGIDTAGRLWLLWGEPAPGTRPTSRLEWMMQQVESVWAAAYDPARREWSAAEQLAKAPAGSGVFAWSSSVADPSPLPGWELGTTVLLTTMHASAAGELRSSVARLRLRDGRWHTELVPLPGPASQASIAALGSTTLLAYIGSAVADRTDNHVVTMRSRDDGNTWTAPSVLDSRHQSP